MSISFEEKNKFEEISLNTIECEFYDNGQTLIQYLDGLKGNIVQKYETFLYTGNVKEYYRNGKTRFAGKYKDGKMWRGTFFDEKNEPKIIRHGNIFIPDEKNQIDGKEIDFYGRTIFEGKYEITKKNGEEYEEYRNGLLKVYNKETNNVSEEFKGDFKNGNKYAGIEKIFDKESGKITYEFAVKYDKNNKTKRNGSILGIEGKKVDDNTKLLNNNVLCFTNKNNNFISDEFDGKEYDLQSNKLVFDGKYCIDKDNTLYDRANGTEYINGKCKFEGSYKKGVRSKGTEFYNSGYPEFEGFYNENGDRLKGVIYCNKKEKKLNLKEYFSQKEKVKNIMKKANSCMKEHIMCMEKEKKGQYTMVKLLNMEKNTKKKTYRKQL